MPYRILLVLLVILLSACSVAEPRRQEQPQTTDQSRNPDASTLPGTAANPPGDTGTVAQPAAPASNDQLLALATDQLIAGEYEEQATTLEQLLAQQPSPEQARLARYGLAESALLQGRADEATQRLSDLLAEGPSDALQAQATMLLARAHESAGRWQAAIEAYQRYRTFNTPLEPYAALRQAAQERAAGQIEQATASYEHVAQQPIARGRRAEALEQLISIYGATGRSDLQLARYRDLIAISQNPDYRAPVLWRAGQLAGNTDEARGWLRELVVTHPARAEALEAVAVLQGTQSISALEAANVHFLHEQYVAAVPLFDAALAGELTPEQRFESRRRRAISIRAQELYDEALTELGALAQQRPVVTITATAQAELDYVQTAGWSGNVPFAIEGYQRFAERFSQHDLAPEALWRAIQLQQNQGDQAGAMAAALDLGRAYPRSTQAHIALTQAGMHYYQSGQRDQAIAAWQLLGDGATGWDSAEGHYWAGSALVQAGRGAEAGAQLQAATTAAPQSFYGMRARQLLQQTSTGSVPLAAGPSEQEQRATLEWIASWTGAAAPQVADEVTQNAHVVRARELGRLDLRNESRDEWFAARDAWNNDPARLWYLALQASAADQPYVALKASERIVALSADKQISPQTPTGLLRLIYPTPYTRVVQREARQFGIDPRLIYALLRQESLFNPDATSWVGARGLGQVMPTTGEGIAQNLQVPNYSADLLYRPAVSIRFAAHYISHQLRAFDNSILVAASAYNGGPGNAARWLENTSDPDLFAEMIDFRETRDYVKIVYGNWGMYQMLYGQ